MYRQLPRSRSRFLAAAVTLTAVVIMLAPLRRGSHEGQARQAGWLPLVSAGGLVDTAAFHRLDVSASRDHACRLPQVRTLVFSPAP